MANRNKKAILTILLNNAGVDRASSPDIAQALLKEADRNGVFLNPKPEFGHAAISVAGVHIDSWGAGPFRIVVDDVIWEFEDSDRFGPIHCENGEPSGYQIMESSNFWPAWKAWKDQGRRVSEDGITCLWDPA